MKKQQAAESRLLDLLKEVLPGATEDPKLAGRIYAAIEKQLKTKARATAFESFCTKAELPNLEPASVASIKSQLAAAFGDAKISIKPDEETQKLKVEVVQADGTEYKSVIKVNPNAGQTDEEQEIVLKFVSFPVALPGDPELIWALAKRENMTNEEAGIALAKVEEDFWASKTGQKLIRDRVDRTFPEFISRAPAGMLSELGLKRHYKLPEAIKIMRSIPQPPRTIKGSKA